MEPIWCDFHALAEVATAVQVQCEVCLEMYPSSHVFNGVCVDCRSVMPLLWVDNEVNHDV